ncbi:MAG: translation elongation factor Ts [Pseudobdellovibrio sp.]
MSISATMVKELREKTSAGMMDCKKALEESKGDFEAAVEWLRIKGLSAAAKKADRVAAEGLVNAANNGKTGAVVEINSETDFASRNDKFKELVNNITQLVLTSASVDQTKVDEMLKTAIATIGENMVFRRSEKYTVQGEGLVHTYVHGEGKIGVMVEIGAASATAAASPEAKTLAADVCMHIAAMNPMALSQDQMDATVVAKEKEILKQKALESGKKPEMLDKITEGQIRKFLAENCLLDQNFVKNPDLTIAAWAKECSKKAGGDLTVKRFVRFELGAGIEKKVVDFAAEVAAQTQNH